MGLPGSGRPGQRLVAPVGVVGVLPPGLRCPLRVVGGAARPGGRSRYPPLLGSVPECRGAGDLRPAVPVSGVAVGTGHRRTARLVVHLPLDEQCRCVRSLG